MNDMTMTETQSGPVNGIDVDALKQVIRDVAADPAKGVVRFDVKSAWQGQTKSRATVESFHIGGEEVKRHFEIDVDEPLQLLGQNSAPNPQEMLMTALNACIMVGYVAGAAMKGDGSEADFREIHETVIKTSPNYFNIARPIRIESRLVVEA